MTMLTRKPRKGDTVVFHRGEPGETIGHVLSIEGNLCWCKWPDGTSNPFIWNFREGMNTMAEIEVNHAD
jgi:hypothetical protein